MDTSWTRLCRRSIVRFVIGLGAVGLATSTFGQTPDVPPAVATPSTETEPAQPELQSLAVYGMSNYAGNRWGALKLVLVNPTDEDRVIQVASYLADYETDQFGKRVWVPARSRIQTWYPFFPRFDRPEEADGAGAAPPEIPSDDFDAIAAMSERLKSPPPSQIDFDKRFDIFAWVADVTTGEAIPLRSGGNEIRRDASVNQELPEKRTAVLSPGTRYTGFSRNLSFAVPPIDPPLEAAISARVMSRRTKRLQMLVPRSIPTEAEVLGSFDQIVVADAGFETDARLTSALRSWVARGGSLWVQADRVDIAWLQELLGDAADVELVDRTSLERVTWTKMRQAASGETSFDYEDPVGFVRLVMEGPRIDWTIDGWPAVGVLPFGDGKILITAIDARAMIKPASESDYGIPPPAVPGTARLSADLYSARYILHPFLAPLVDEQFADPTTPRASSEALARYVNENIGYEIPSRAVVFTILSGFCLTIALGGTLLFRAGKASAMLVLTPVLALLATAVLFGIGFGKRGNVPEMTAEVQLVSGVDGVSTVDVRSTGAVYVASSEPREVRTTGIGPVRLMRPSSSAEIRRQIWVDGDTIALENIASPIGQSEFVAHRSMQLAGPVVAEGTFDADGVVGRLVWPGVETPEDALVAFENARVPVAFSQGGNFRIAADARLAPGQFLAESTLADEQQRRQQIYRDLFDDPSVWDLMAPTIFFWSGLQGGSPEFDGIDRRSGAALSRAVLRWNRPAPNTPVRIPQAFLRMRTSADATGERATSLYAWRTGEWIENKGDAKVYLRFEIPESLRPFRPERIEIGIDLRAEGRRVALSTLDGENAIEVASAESPRGRLSAVIDDPSRLAVGSDGGWVLVLDVTDIEWPELRPAWKIDDLTIDIRGTANVADPVPATAD
ncbi:MAG TPA: hypothetical protein DCQ98_20235 [Planctomycetaceae bacterium]|nr:hypothetical protein [Planctomycetaceae bacterium]HRF00896.1 hypothetical protein [Pirellulaceae bacterium]